MKFTFLGLFFLLSISALALADDLAKHQEFCNSEVVNSIKGKGGSCRIILIPKKNDFSMGACTGVLMSTLTCKIEYALQGDVSAMNITCGEDIKKPIINQDITASSIKYNVAALITNSEGEETVLIDPTGYISISSRNVSIFINEREGSEEHSISILLDEEPSELTDLKCE